MPSGDGLRCLSCVDTGYCAAAVVRGRRQCGAAWRSPDSRGDVGALAFERGCMEMANACVGPVVEDGRRRGLPKLCLAGPNIGCYPGRRDAIERGFERKDVR